MRTAFSLIISTVLATVAHAQGLPPVQYVNGAPACPTDLDIKNMETRLSASVIPAANRFALNQEKAKAIQCRSIGARYTEQDFKRMQAVIRGEN